MLGAGWGAGAGAVIGNQTGNTGEGAAIGAGFGAVAGAVEGVALDELEKEEIRQQREMDVLQVQVATNRRNMQMLQAALDERDAKLKRLTSTSKVYFEKDETELSIGGIERLERFADAIKMNPYAGIIQVHGYTDDVGNKAANQRLSKERADTVAVFLSSRGVSIDQIRTFAHGAEKSACK